jgi:putative dehydrogenase
MNARIVTVIGVGNMGGAMAANLLGQGWDVRVCDIDAAKAAALVQQGATAVVHPAAAFADSLAFIVCVVDAAQTEDVLFGEHGLARMLRPGHTVMLCPTIAPQDVESFAARLAERGVHTLDAPMSGGPVRARDGSMSLMLACTQAVYEQQAGLLQALSAKVFHISESPATAPAPNWSTTCWQASTWWARPRLWRWPGAWGWTWARRWTSSSSRAGKAG